MDLAAIKLTGLEDIEPALLVNDPDAWDAVIENCSSVRCEYLRSMVAYQTTYMAEHSDHLISLDAVLYHGGKPIAVWPLNLCHADGAWVVRSNAVPVLPPLFAGSVSKKQKKSIISFSLASLNNICAQMGIAEWQGTEILACGHASDWHSAIMKIGATVRAHHELFIDLEMELSAIRSNFRKSYKPLINKAKTLWQCRIVDENFDTAFEKFRDLHILVAGRETRSQKTWDLLEEAVENGDGFIVFLEDASNQLIGAALFYHSATDAVYSVAAYDRDYFDKPVGHLVQMTAITHLKDIGIRNYRLGYRPYPGDSPEPNEKELNIGFFKEGFSSHSCLNLLTLAPVRSGE